jgi:transcriptional regulator with XRE-family HTH domain
LLDWSQLTLAKHARVGVVTVQTFERGIAEPRQATLTVIVQAFEKEGIEFTDGDAPGLKLRKVVPPKPKKKQAR